MKVLMVCLGNICRSPMAEGILRTRAKENGMDLSLDSAGTGNYHIGEQPDHRAMEYMRQQNMDISDLRARQFVVHDFDAFDIIFAMDSSNHANILKLARNEADRKKVRMILAENPASPKTEVPDPYFGGMEGFVEVFELLDDACQAFIEKNHQSQQPKSSKG